MEVLKQISRVSSIPIIVGYVRKEGKRIYNSAAICYDGKLQSYYDKIPYQHMMFLMKQGISKAD